MLREDLVPKTFRAYVESAERKFSRVRDTPLHPYGGVGLQHGQFFHKVFKAYMRLWKFQQENRARLVECGLQRWEIGEIASRIGQLYFNHYLRTSEARFLLEAYIFYEAIFNRNYFEGSRKDRGVRFKELRFYARFFMVSLVLNRVEMVKLLVEKFKELVDESRVNFQDTNFKEWKLVVQETVRFTKADSAILNPRPLRYTTLFDSHPASLPFVAKFHAKRLLKFRDAVLTSYHKNEVKFAELTLDNFRMLQCLEWEPSGSFYQKHALESRQNGLVADHSASSGLIDINLVADMTDPTLPPNPKKAVLYRPSAPQLIAVIAKVCEELPTDSVVLIYLSASGNSGHCSTSQMGNSGISGKFPTTSASSNNNHGQMNGCENHVSAKEDSNYFENYLLLGPSRNGGSNILFPDDIIPFTRKPLFLIVDSDSSNAFKVLHGSERGEPAALFLSPLRTSFRNPSGISVSRNGSQFTLFLAAPLQSFCQLVNYNLATNSIDVYNGAESILNSAFSEWEEILCTSSSLNLVWAQLLTDPFLRRLIIRFIFCRAVLSLFCLREIGEEYLPVCIPALPDVVAVKSKAVQPAINRLADHFKVADCFMFS